MLNPDSVAPYFTDLYNTKIRKLRDNLVRLDQLLSRHNFYDCQTVLLLRHPETHRKAILLQADMDVDADGSDSDRLPGGSGMSPNFKPFTSLRWPKKTSNPNPYLEPTEERLRKAETELAQKAGTPERKNELRSAIGRIREEITSLKKFSFLIGATDPYIVLPADSRAARMAARWAITPSLFLETRFIPPSSAMLDPPTKSARHRCASRKKSTRFPRR